MLCMIMVCIDAPCMRVCMCVRALVDVRWVVTCVLVMVCFVLRIVWVCVSVREPVLGHFCGV